MAYNYGLLESGAHQLKIRAVDKQGLIEEITMPIETERFQSSFIRDPSSMDLSAATIRGNNQTLSIDNLKVDGERTNVTMKWRRSYQGFAIEDVTYVQSCPFTGEWSGEYSANSCQGYFEEAWVGVVDEDCMFSAQDADEPWELIYPTKIDEATGYLNGPGVDEGCGAITFTATFSEDTVYGSWSGAHSNGTFYGTKGPSSPVTGQCEMIAQVENYTYLLEVMNGLNVAIETYLPTYAFGAYMRGGECVRIGLRNVTEVELTRCDVDVGDQCVGPSKAVSVYADPGAIYRINVTPEYF